MIISHLNFEKTVEIFAAKGIELIQELPERGSENCYWLAKPLKGGEVQRLTPARAKIFAVMMQDI